MGKVLLAVLCGVFAVALCTSTAMYMSLYEELRADRKHIVALERKVAQLEENYREHEDIMRTYEFFNDRWTREMKGE